jgi:tetratricopeptide (TPR) repeat protein
MEERRLGVQTFYMAPEEIEDKLKQHAPRAEQADPVTHRRTLGILAGFAFARKDYEQAARLQADWGARAESGGAMAEAASAYYNLGNTMLARGELLDAEQQYLKCCELCLQHGTNGLLPMALTNLGVTLFRQDRTAEALESLRVAHRTFKAQRHRPGEAFVYDALASVYVERQQFDEAEKAWFAALEAYKGITSDAFADLRDSGCEDIRAKLTRFYEATGRPNRLSQRRERT